MAIIFELVINFGNDRSAAETAAHLLTAHPPLAAGRHQIPLHRPLFDTVRDASGEPYLQMSVIPAQVGFGCALDKGRPRLPLTPAELSELGNGLYSVLTTLTGYRAAQVGWDPEDFVDPVELRQQWVEELAAGTLPGLVLAETLLSDAPTQAFVPFTNGFIWLPYQDG
jgi:hypothetical protein